MMPDTQEINTKDLLIGALKASERFLALVEKLPGSREFTLSERRKLDLDLDESLYDFFGYMHALKEHGTESQMDVVKKAEGGIVDILGIEFIEAALRRVAVRRTKRNHG